MQCPSAFAIDLKGKLLLLVIDGIVCDFSPKRYKPLDEEMVSVNSAGLWSTPVLASITSVCVRPTSAPGFFIANYLVNTVLSSSYRLVYFNRSRVLLVSL